MSGAQKSGALELVDSLTILYSVITPKSEDKYVVKVFNWSEVHLSDMTCYKIHTLMVFFILMDNLK